MKGVDLASGAAVAGTFGLAGLLLPPLKETFDAEPGAYAERLRTAELSFGAMVLGFGLLQSMAAGNWLPLVVAGGIVGIVLLTYERAYRYQGPSGGQGQGQEPAGPQRFAAPFGWTMAG